MQGSLRRTRIPTMKLRKILQITAGLIFFAIIAGYSLYQIQDYQAGPSITIETPAHGISTTSPLITISGEAQRVAYLTLNGRQIFTDRSGNFEEELLLTAGYNIITVAAEDTFERKTEKQIGVTLHASSTLLFSYNNSNE